jgi:hypothetical protein
MIFGPSSTAMLACLLLVLAQTSDARAQVNIEPYRQKVAQQGSGVAVRASMASYAGNTRGVIFGSAALVGIHGAKNFAFLTLSGDYTRLNGEVSVAKWFGHLRHDYQLRDWLAWEEYGQIESDRFRRIRLRELVGTGPRFGLARGDVFELYYGASYMYEHTKLDTAATGGRGQGGAHRFSNYISALLHAHERVTLSSVTYYQPRFDRVSDYILLSVNGADFTITSRLHSRVDVVARFDSITPPDVKRADLELKSALELTF